MSASENNSRPRDEAAAGKPEADPPAAASREPFAASSPGFHPAPSDDASPGAVRDEHGRPVEFSALAPGPPAHPQLPEDLRAPWGWPDLILLLVFVLGSSIVFPLLVGLAAVLWWGVHLAEIEHSASIKAAILVASQALWSAATLLYLFAVVRLRHHGPFWHAIGWRQLRLQTMPRWIATLLCLLGGSGLAFVVLLASAVVGKKTKLPIEEFFQNRRSVLLLMALGILVAPVVEETIFRGYVYPVLARGLGIPIGVALTGTLFGLAHAAQLWGGWGQIALLILVGVVLTYVRARTGTVLASYLFHVSYNSFLFAGLYFATGGLRHFPANS